MEKPVRKIGKNARSVTGYISKQPKNVLVQFESTLERDFINLLEFDYEVMDYIEQPVTIEYIMDGRHRYYTPDFLVRYMPSDPQRPPMLCEIKYTEDLIKYSSELKPKFEAAKKYCKGKGYTFEVLTEENIRSPYLTNVKFLRHYKNKLSEVNTYDIDMLLNNLMKLEPTTAAELLSSCTELFEKKAELTYVLWVLVANHRIECDLTSRLTMNTKIWML